MEDISIYVAKIVYSTSVDGVGLRNSLYVSGCPIHCPGCHNKDFWPLASGTPMPLTEVFNRLTVDECNISILGGEPLYQYEAILRLCKLIKERTDKSIWLWTGYPLEKLPAHKQEIFDYLDVVVDGPFMEELKDDDILWRGSSNQRVIQSKDFKSYLLKK